MGRRRLLGQLLREYCPNAKRFLDAGCGTGANLRMLFDLGVGTISGIDASPLAISVCREKGFFETVVGDIRSLPYADDSFDVVFATDIVEHVAEDDAAATEIFRVLCTGGHAVFTVPAFPSLWGLQDDVSQHQRRYRIGPFCRLLETAGFTVKELFHFNIFLFLPIWAARQFIRLSGMSIQSENDINTPFLNSVLKWIFAFDIASARRIRLPFGVSICAVAVKR